MGRCSARALAELRGDTDLQPNSLGDFNMLSLPEMEAKAEELVRRLQTSKRPVLLAGGGVRMAGCHDAFLELAERLGIPAVSAWNAHDAIPDAHPCYCGRPGTIGDRPGNFTVQNADFLLTLGCRLNIRQISYDWKAFASRAWKAQVDADPAELYKPTLNTDLPIPCRPGGFSSCSPPEAGRVGKKARTCRISRMVSRTPGTLSCSHGTPPRTGQSQSLPLHGLSFLTPRG